MTLLVQHVPHSSPRYTESYSSDSEKMDDLFAGSGLINGNGLRSSADQGKIVVMRTGVLRGNTVELPSEFPDATTPGMTVGVFLALEDDVEDVYE